jgi:hypothetical protein
MGLLFAFYGMKEAGMRLVILLLGLLGGLVLVGMLVAPYQPGLRGWYLQNGRKVVSLGSRVVEAEPVLVVRGALRLLAVPEPTSPIPAGL